MAISLKPVSVDNWYNCTQLEVTKDQKKVFPAPIVYWIAESKYVTDFEPMTIYYSSDIIGFIVYCKIPDNEGNYWIPALMIDERYQGKGHGKESMKQLIELMKETLNCQRIMIGHRPENTVAGNLYESLGFERVSKELIDGEVVRHLMT
ncbi:spermidine acetyltransferase [Paenibacillus selenitireducens]|uniref:Spermidine acetyltransferase n=1 Tax=Paenibacillus selenitireducens TaxID=1324314 RepID=A0A1T2WZK3_9BACL|nr:GNAT family N-acetyltransferase [Paenibacillus selenitireducens]OPA73054.1 spermidine acetyltransferase [Paenibacillus selenitireducens]